MSDFEDFSKTICLKKDQIQYFGLKINVQLFTG